MSSINVKVSMRYRIDMTPEGDMLLNAGAFTPEELTTVVRLADVQGDDHDRIWYVTDDLSDGTCLCHVAAHDDVGPDEVATLIARYTLESDVIKIVT